MFVLYNMLQTIFLPVFFPFIAIFVLCKSKYRDRIPSRLGLGLRRKLQNHGRDLGVGPVYWIHALSVGEVTSALPLVSGLKQDNPDSRVIFSVTTKSGRQVADNLLVDLADEILDSPLDILPVVAHFHRLIRPDFFILVETDFWPNQLLYLQMQNVPALLVNGRVSEEALQGYKRMKFFFKPMFTSFSALCMQTEIDREKLQSLGVEEKKLHTLGNLKFDTKNPLKNGNNDIVESIKSQLPQNRIIFLAGSTHPGEEQILLESYCDLRNRYADLFLAIAPREPGRAPHISVLAKEFGLEVALRSEPPQTGCDVFILNSIGELSACYSLANISFVGGSLVKKGGHNPIEPAVMALPVIFGPHMEDFSEIAESLMEVGGATEVRNSKEISAILELLLNSPDASRRQGQMAQDFVEKQRGVIQRYLQLIQNLA